MPPGTVPAAGAQAPAPGVPPGILPATDVPAPEAGTAPAVDAPVPAAPQPAAEPTTDAEGEEPATPYSTGDGPLPSHLRSLWARLKPLPPGHATHQIRP